MIRSARRRRRPAPAVLAIWALLVLAAGALPAAARADGDPASDVLLVNNTFLPYGSAVSPALSRALDTAVARAHAAGYPVKVAVIASKLDLGADPNLFGTPERYAKFLDLEITYNSSPPLLVVMPQGFGTAATAPVAALGAITIDASAGSDGLARAAVAAVVALSRRGGHPIAAPALPAVAPASGGTSAAPIAAAAAVALVLAAGGLAGVRARRRRRAPAPR